MNTISFALQSNASFNKSSSYNFQICSQSIVASHKIIYTKDQQIANVYRGPKESIKTPIFVGILLYTVHCVQYLMTVEIICTENLFYEIHQIFCGWVQNRFV